MALLRNTLDVEKLYLSVDCCDAGLDENRLPSTSALAGRRLDLHDVDSSGPALSVLISDAYRRSPSRLVPTNREKLSITPSRCARALFFIDWQDPIDVRLAFSLILDEPSAYATLLRSRITGSFGCPAESLRTFAIPGT